MLEALNAHTGARSAATSESFSSLNTFKTWISKAFGVAPQNQILLTAQGRQLRFQSLSSEAEIFVYDRQLLLSSTDAPSPNVPPILTTAFEPLQAIPKVHEGVSDLAAWHNLFRESQSWALHSAKKCRSLASCAQKRWDERSVIERGLVAALENLKTHVRLLEQKHAEAQEWYQSVWKEQKATLDTWEAVAPYLGDIPGRYGIIRLVLASESLRSDDDPDAQCSLSDFVSQEDVSAAASTARSVLEQLSSQSRRISQLKQQVVSDSDLLSASIEGEEVEPVEEGRNKVAQLMEDIDVVASKVAADHKHILALPATAKSLTQASKMALLQTRNYFPGIEEDYRTMYDYVQQANAERNASARKGIRHMQTVAKIQSVLANANARLQAFEITPEGVAAFEAMALPSRLPLIYGMLLVEAMRRQEWYDKLRSDSRTLGQEFAGYEAMEDRRRKRWLRTMESMVDTDMLQGAAVGLKIDVKNEEHMWPSVSRHEVDLYLKGLQSIDGLDAVESELKQALEMSDCASKQQNRRPTSFKMGSVHEAGFGKASLLLRGDDDVRHLRDTNVRLEDELRGHKSRIRKLEDLLHRQGQISRNASGNIFQVVPNMSGQDAVHAEAQNPPPSPVHEYALSRKSSVASRRLSANQSSEDKKLARRIVSLEAEMVSQNEQRQTLERQVAANQSLESNLRNQVEELDTIKRDLMHNMDSKQREFADERKLLEDQIAKYQEKLEEMEDEWDRILGSREKITAGANNKIQAVERELEAARTNAAGEAVREQQKASKEVLELRNALQAELERHQVVQNEHWNYLRRVRTRFSPESPAATQLDDLLEDVDILAKRAVDEARVHAEELTVAKSESESLQIRLGSETEELAKAQAELQSRKDEISRLTGEHRTEASKIATLSAQLEAEREELDSLRKFAEGETGSGTLRQHIAEEQSKSMRLLTELTDAKSHVNGLDVELLGSQKKYRQLQADYESLSSRLQRRSAHARDLTQKLYAHNSRLSRLLESLGFVITPGEGAMTLQRISKSTGASVFLDSPTPSSLASAPSPAAKRAFGDIFTPNLLDWINEDESVEDERFSQYGKAVEFFNLDTLSDTIIKRLRDMEHTARKWQKDARIYREKNHRAQSDAQEKIAFRGFKEGDLALFLPTRNQANRPWAAFNVGAPHYFLREQDSHRLRNREWLVARIQKIEERIVDLSKSIEGVNTTAGDGRSVGDASDGVSLYDDNPFELSDGLRWYLVDAAEERAGAPSTPGLGKTTVASAHIDARGSIRIKTATDGNNAGKALNKSLDSRRSSSNSKRGVAPSSAAPVGKLDTVTSGGEEGDQNESHLRTETANNVEEERTARAMSPAKAALIRAASPAKSTAQRVEASPVKAAKSLASSPAKSIKQPPRSPSSKSGEKQKGGLWDTLWQFDLSYESGKKR